LALAAVMAAGIVMLTVCLFVAAFGGMFGNLFASAPDQGGGAPLETLAPRAADLATRFDDGQWLVGHDIVAGTYQATVPAGSAGCVWERASSSDGTLGSVLDSGAGDPGRPVVVTIKTTDVVFRSHECGHWIQIAGPDAS
jgi:hypothetical protein